jgi:hypothetical protein
LQQKYIKNVYDKFPQQKGVCHRVHATVAIVMREWQLAENDKRTPDVRQVSVKAINKACAAMSLNCPQWPDIVRSTDLSQLAAEQPMEHQWWLPDRASDDGEDGK